MEGSQTRAEYEGCDKDTLELEGDSCINYAIKKHALLGKVLSNKAIQHLKVAAILQKIWNCEKALECHDLEKNVLLFVFESSKDKERILSQCPWSVNNRLLILKEWPTEATLEEVDFSLAEFWVQVHNIPMALINGKNSIKIGNLFPMFIKSNLEHENGVKWDGQLRIRVALRVEDPLKTGFSLSRMAYDPIEVGFKYERLPEFCYQCGRLGHSEKECWYDLKYYKRAGSFGPWLRASATWVKQNDSFRKKESVHHNLQIQDSKLGTKSNGEGTREEKNELTARHDSPTQYVSTRFSDIAMGCQITKALHDSEINLGSSKDPVCQGIVAEWSPMNRIVLQTNSKTMVLSDGHSQWNKSLVLPNQEMYVPAVNKGKSILEYSKEKANDKMEDFVSGYLQDMDISSCRKRKMDNFEGWDFSATKKRELMKQIYEGIHEISPGNWGDDGFGPIANENVLKLALFPESVANVSSIINRIEKKKRGCSFGSRRLSLIKRAARRKHVLEITRLALEDHLIVERGVDPFGLNLNCNPTLEVANDPMMSEDSNYLAFEVTGCSSYADDSMESHLQKL